MNWDNATKIVLFTVLWGVLLYGCVRWDGRGGSSSSSGYGDPTETGTWRRY